MVLVTIKDPGTGKVFEYYMDDKLNHQVDKNLLPSLHKKDEDGVYIVDGGEGVGKSVFAMQFGKKIDPALDLSKVCFDHIEFRKAVIKAEKGQVIIFDEAYRGLGSRGVLTEVNKVLVNLMMEMRQKNLCVIVVLPTFFLLEKYVALWRAKGVFHVFKSKGKRGYWRYYNKRKKRLLYLKGKRDYGYHYVKSNFKGRFYNFYTVDEEEYRAKKKNALERSYRSTRSETYQAQRNKIIRGLYLELKWDKQKISDFCKKYKFNISRKGVAYILKQFEDDY